MLLQASRDRSLRVLGVRDSEESPPVGASVSAKLDSEEKEGGLDGGKALASWRVLQS
jgi:hypothetical protein